MERLRGRSCTLQLTDEEFKQVRKIGGGSYLRGLERIVAKEVRVVSSQGYFDQFLNQCMELDTDNWVEFKVPMKEIYNRYLKWNPKGVVPISKSEFYSRVRTIPSVVVRNGSKNILYAYGMGFKTVEDIEEDEDW